MNKVIGTIVILVIIGAIFYYATLKPGANYQAPTPAAEPTTPPPAPEAVAPEAIAPAAEVKISIKSFAFNPATVTVKKGTKITWTEEDNAPHIVASADGTLNSPRLSLGQTWSFTPTAAGTIDYHCGVHPTMLGKVVVTE